MEKLDRITINAARMNGEPCIQDLRLTVRRVLEALAIYPDRAELKREYPQLEDEDIRQALAFALQFGTVRIDGDRKSTRLNSSHTVISYAVFCLKKKRTTE